MNVEAELKKLIARVDNIEKAIKSSKGTDIDDKLRALEKKMQDQEKAMQDEYEKVTKKI